MTIGVAIVTYQAESSIASCLAPLVESGLKPRILVIDSSSTDRTVLIAKGLGVEVVVIPKEEFNHGLTREKARKLLNTEVVVFLTQDAILTEPKSLECLVDPILKGKASVSYAKQLPHKGAGFFESFHREFNYPSTTQYRSLEEAKKFGVYTCFCSNSCAAYRNASLDEIGGFSKTNFGEDTLAAAQLILKGDVICYVAEAKVFHSHSYTLMQEFYRHLNIGLYRKKNVYLFQQFGSDKQRGKLYVRKLIKKVLVNKPWLLPYAFLQILIKALGYFIGGRFLLFNKVHLYR